MEVLHRRLERDGHPVTDLDFELVRGGPDLARVPLDLHVGVTGRVHGLDDRSGYRLRGGGRWRGLVRRRKRRRRTSGAGGGAVVDAVALAFAGSLEHAEDETSRERNEQEDGNRTGCSRNSLLNRRSGRAGRDARRGWACDAPMFPCLAVRCQPLRHSRHPAVTKRHRIRLVSSPWSTPWIDATSSPPQASAPSAWRPAQPRRRRSHGPADRTGDGSQDREHWVRVLTRLADPVLTHLAAGTLRARMPVEQAPGANRAGVTHLEAFGRLVAGVAPWLELGPDDSPRRAPARALRGTRAGGPGEGRRPRLSRRHELHDGRPAAGGCGVPRAGPAARAPATAARAGCHRHGAAGRGARVVARHAARLQQLAALRGHGRSRAARAGREVGQDARRLRPPPARPVVQGRRRVRRRPVVPLGLLQQLRHPPDARRRARGVWGRGRRRGSRCARGRSRGRRDTRACSSG